MAKPTKINWGREGMGALSSIFVSLPGNLAFGMIAFAPLGDDYLSLGIIAAMYSSIIIGVASGILGGVPGLISGPQATTAMLFAALISKLSATLPEIIPDFSLAHVLTCAFLAVFLAGFMQMLFGFLKVGTLVKFIPFPVTSGFLIGAIILIVKGQVWTLAGMDKHPVIWDLARHADQILWPTVLVGVLTMAVMFMAGRITKKVPAAILAVIIGSCVYYLIYLTGFREGLGQTLGAINLSLPKPEYISRFFGLATGGHLFTVISLIMGTALSIALLNTIDSLLSIVVLQSHLEHKPRSNREEVAQGVGNMASAVFGGLPGAGFIGRTVVNLKSGARTGWSTVFASILLLLSLYVLSPLIALIPKAVISAVLVAVLIQIIDPWVVGLFRKVFSAKLFSHTEYMENVVCIALVVFIAVQYDLVAAVGVGVVLSGVMFVLKMVKSPIRRVYNCASVRSKRMLDEKSLRLLAEHGKRIIVIHLDGVLFFGTVDRIQDLLMEKAEEDPVCIILDMTRVDTIDSTGTNILMQAREKLKSRGVSLFFANLGKDTRPYSVLEDLDFFNVVDKSDLYEDLDRALEAAEDRLLAGLERGDPPPLEFGLGDFSMFKGLSSKELDTLEKYFTRHPCAGGEHLFESGDKSDGLYLIARGRLEVYILIGERRMRLKTLVAGSFLGEMSLLESSPRSASVECIESGLILQLTPERFQDLVSEQPGLAIRLLSGMLTIASERLRAATQAIRDLSQ